MDNQNAFLKTIRASLGLPSEIIRPASSFRSLFTRTEKVSTLQPQKKMSDARQLELVNIFEMNAQALGISTHVVRTTEEAAAVVVDLVRSKDPEFTHTKHLMQHDHPDLAALQLWKRFNREGITVHTSFSPDLQLRDKTVASYIGITAPAIGIADSATLVQFTAPGAPRSTSLVPSIHVAVLKSENLVANLGEAYALLQARSLPDSFVFITGPSKTADIEAQMVHGAHGPKEVHVLIVLPFDLEQAKAEKPGALEISTSSSEK